MEAEVLADLPGRYGIDRGIALAFFVHESSAGKAGITLRYDTKNWGNLRRVQNTARGTVIQTTGGPFAKYVSWTAGLEDWCELLVETYEERWGLTRLGDILRKYAPKEDNNDPEWYAKKVLQHIQRWRAEEGAVPVEVPKSQNGTQPWKVRVTPAIGLNIRSGPGVTFERTGVLPKDAVVEVTGAENGWLKLSDGRGFVFGYYTQREASHTD